MDTSVYIMLSRQMAQFEAMSVTSNNIANMNTPGYNSQKMVFRQHLTDAGKIGQQDAYADTPGGYRDTSTGAMQITNNPLDLAITGPGYFQVETPLGVRYTKAGNFKVDASGMLVTSNGYPVLGADGSQITIPQGARKIEINGVGQISVDNNASGQIGVMEFADEQSMTRFGNSLYGSQAQPLPAQTARVMQGALESSNVNGVTELVQVMEIARGVGNTAKFIETMYDLERKTSNTLSARKQA